MNNSKFKRGLKQNLPVTAQVGMPLWCTDTHELYIGTGSGVAKIGDSYTKAEIDTLIGNIETLLSEV